jgi:hypothetical protein
VTLTARERRRAALAGLVLGLAALVAIDAAILLNPEQLRRRLVAYVERFVRGEVELEGVRFGLTGRGQVARAVLRPAAARGGEGGGRLEGGELRIEGLRLDDAPLELLRGRYQVTRIAIDAMEARIHDPSAFLESFERLVEVDPEGVGPPAPVTIGRLEVRIEGLDLPFFTPISGPVPIVLERVRITAEGGGRRFFRLAAKYKGGPLEACAISGRLDMQEATLTLDLRASNVDVRGRSLAGLPERARRFLAGLEPAGPFDLALVATVPWRRPRETAVRGEVDCYGLSLAPPGFARPLGGIAGRIRFEGRRVEIEELRGLYGASQVRLYGSVGDIEEGTGIDLTLSAPGLDLSEIAGAPLPEPISRAVAAVGLGGRGDLRVTLAGGVGAGRLAASLAAREPTVACALASKVAGTLELAGPLALGPFEGAFRIERGELARAARAEGEEEPAAGAGGRAGPALRAVTGRIAIRADALVLEQVEGQLADGSFHGALEVGPAGGALRADLAAREVAVAPIASALLGRALAFEGRATGTFALARRPGARLPTIKVELELGPCDPRALPPVASLCDAVLAGNTRPGPAFERGRFSLSREDDGRGRAVLALEGRAGTLAARAALRPDGTLAGSAEARRPARLPASYAVAGPLLAPEIRAVPLSATRTAD